MSDPNVVVCVGRVKRRERASGWWYSSVDGWDVVYPGGDQEVAVPEATGILSWGKFII